MGGECLALHTHYADTVKEYYEVTGTNRQKRAKKTANDTSQVNKRKRKKRNEN